MLSSDEMARKQCRMILSSSLIESTDMELIEDKYIARVNGSFFTGAFFKWFILPAGVVMVAYLSENAMIIIVSLISSILLCSGLFQRLIFFVTKLYIDMALSLDSNVHLAISTIRKREIAIFGLQWKMTTDVTVCVQSMRTELLETMRDAVKGHLKISRFLLRDSDEGIILLENVFTDDMRGLVFGEDKKNEYLQLAAFKELWQLLYLLRSENLRLLLLKMLDMHLVGLLFFNLMFLTEMLRFKQLSSRITAVIEFIDHQELRGSGRKLRFVLPSASIDEKVCIYLEIALDIMRNSNETIEAQKESRNKVLCIARELLEILEPRTKVPVNEESGVESGRTEASFLVDPVSDQSYEMQPQGDQVFEGYPLADTDEKADNMSICQFEQDEKKSSVVAKSLLEELKAVLEQKKENSAESNSQSVQNRLENEKERRTDSSPEKLPTQEDSHTSKNPGEPLEHKSEPSESACYSPLTELQQALSSRTLIPCTLYTCSLFSARNFKESLVY